MRTISLVIPTIGSPELLDAVIQSLSRYGQNLAEIVIVRQGRHGDWSIDPTLSLPMIAVHDVQFVGLSKAKNFGAKVATSDFVFFLDDDARFLPETMPTLASFIASGDYDAYFGKTVDASGVDSVAKFQAQASRLTHGNYRGKFIECPSVIRRELLLKEPFDEEMGAGTFYGAEEGHDLVLRLLVRGASLYYDPSFRVYHPHKVGERSSFEAIRRAFNYRCGFGYLCAKHKLYGQLFLRLILVVMALMVFGVTARKRVRFYVADLLGTLSGFWVRRA